MTTDRGWTFGKIQARHTSSQPYFSTLLDVLRAIREQAFESDEEFVRAVAEVLGMDVVKTGNLTCGETEIGEGYLFLKAKPTPQDDEWEKWVEEITFAIMRVIRAKFDEDRISELRGVFRRMPKR